MYRTASRLLLVLALSFLFSLDASAQFTGCKNIQQVTREACEVLEKLFHETNGIFWFNRQGWLTANQPCGWFGVTCAATEWPRPVTKIHLVSNNVGGTLPADLSLLSELKELVIENRDAVAQFNTLSGTLPPVLGNLSNLEVLQLSRNNLQGRLPATLGKLSKLRILHLDDNGFNDRIPVTLGDLSLLERLDLSSNQLFGAIPTELGNLDSLKHLNLSANTLEGTIPTELGNLTNLISLDLHANNLTGSIPASLSNLGLFWLSLSDNDLSGALPLNVATSLAATNTCFLTNNAPGLCIPDTPPYQALGANPICGLPLDAACSLCANTSEIPEAECRALEALYPHTNGSGWTNQTGWLATDTPCSWTGVSCTNGAVTALVLPQNNLEGAIPSTLGTLSKMRVLDLSGNDLQGTIPEEIGNLKRLTTLDLGSNQITGAVPLAVAEVGVSTTVCRFANNDPGLCIPDTPPFRALGADPICGLPLRSTCTSSLLVEIVSFEAAAETDAVLLTWTTNRGASDVRFDVERKVDDAFEGIGTVEGTGSADQAQSYSFRATHLERGFHTFRLKQVDVNGAFRYSMEVTVLLALDDFVFEPAFPNPFRSSTRLRFAVATAQVVVADLYNVMGQRVRTLYAGTPAPGQMQTLHIDHAGLTSGLYVIHLTGAGGFTAIKKIMLVK